MSQNIPLTVTIAHDYLCPWCWVGYFQAQRLKQEFPMIAQTWVGYELLPEELGPLPEHKPKAKDKDTPSRLDRFAEAEGAVVPEERTIGVIRTHNPLEGAEWFKEHMPDRFDDYNGAVYRAFWERSVDISDMDKLADIARSCGADADAFRRAVEGKTYYDKIVRFDDDAYARDITHVPTFIFRGERCAEAPYSTIRDMATRFMTWYGK